MTTYGSDASKLLGSYKVKLQLDGDAAAANYDDLGTAISAVTAADDEWFPIEDVNVSLTHPDQRVVFGTKRTYFPGPPDTEMTFGMKAASDILDKLIETYGVLDSGGYKITTWVFETSDNADSATAKHIAFYGALRDWSLSRGADPSDPVTMRCTVRIMSDNIAVI